VRCDKDDVNDILAKPGSFSPQSFSNTQLSLSRGI
jgi:hypothetical protein